jgi:hypothetical protein
MAQGVHPGKKLIFFGKTQMDKPTEAANCT